MTVAPTSPFGLAILGAGYIADLHARAASELPGVRLVAAYSWRPERLAALADAHDIPRRYTSLDGLLADDEVDGVVVGLPNAEHAPATIASLESGRAVLVEKPMATSVAEAEAMVAAADAHGRALMVGHMWRFRPEVRAVREAIDAGRIGRPFKTKGYGIHVDWGPSGWFVERARAGGGALADMGIHALDTAWYLLGEPRPRRVFASVATHFLDADVEDSAVVVVEFEGGAASIIESGWHHPHADGPEAHTQVFGTGGYAEVFPPRLSILDGSARRWEELGTVETPHIGLPMYVRQLDRFVAAARGAALPEPSGRQGLEVVRMMEAAYRSAETGAAVEL